MFIYIILLLQKTRIILSILNTGIYDVLSWNLTYYIFCDIFISDIF